MSDFQLEKETSLDEVFDDALAQVSGGSDNYAEIIQDVTGIGNVVPSKDTPEMIMPVGAITEA